MIRFELKYVCEIGEKHLFQVTFYRLSDSNFSESCQLEADRRGSHTRLFPEQGKTTLPIIISTSDDERILLRVTEAVRAYIRAMNKEPVFYWVKE